MRSVCRCVVLTWLDCSFILNVYFQAGMKPGLIQNNDSKEPDIQGQSSEKTKSISNYESMLPKSFDEQSSSPRSSLSRHYDSSLDCQEINIQAEHRIHIQASEMPRIFFCSKI